MAGCPNQHSSQMTLNTPNSMEPPYPIEKEVLLLLKESCIIKCSIVDTRRVDALSGALLIVRLQRLACLKGLSPARSKCKRLQSSHFASLSSFIYQDKVEAPALQKGPPSSGAESREDNLCLLHEHASENVSCIPARAATSDIFSDNFPPTTWLACRINTSHGDTTRMLYAIVGCEPSVTISATTVSAILHTSETSLNTPPKMNLTFAHYSTCQ
jgi:hypothetical protein